MYMYGGSVWVGSAFKKYRILEIYVFAAWKPVLTSRGSLKYRDSGQR